MIESKKFKWQLSSISGWFDWEDVRMQLLGHIYKKWHLYDQTKSLKAWLSTVVNNQILNLLRNLYGNFQKPCIKCPEYEGGDFCKKFHICSTKCDLYKIWVKGKKQKHDINLPLPMENHMNEVYDLECQHIDIDKTALNIHSKMKDYLTSEEYHIYDLLFIQHKSEEDISKTLKYRTREVGRNPGYKQISLLRKKILQKIKEFKKS